MLQKVKATIAQEQQIKNSSGTNAAKRAKVSPLLTEFKTELQALHDQLAPLQPPAGQETAFRQYLDSLAKGAIAAGQARTALDNNDQSAYTAADTQVSMEARKGNAAGAQVPALKVCVTG
jgi:hypothetical protein